MNGIIITDKARIRQACDQCYKGKRRCNLSVPTCSYCKKQGKVCTRERKSNRRAKVYNDEEIHSKAFSSSQSNKARREIIFKSTIILNHRYFDQFKIRAGGNRSDSNTSIASFFPIKMFHSPVMFDQSSYSFYNVAPNQYLNSFFNKLPSVKSESTVIKSSVSICNIMPQLITLYFQRYNTLLPLFTYNQFINKKRDKMLIYSIMLVSLTATNDSQDLLNLKVFLKDKLLEHFQPSKLKISLSNIQSMVILLNGLKGSSFALPSYYFSNINNHCMLLGLHLNYKDDIERKLCYSAVLFLTSIDDPYSALLFDTHDLWKKEKTTTNSNKNESTEKIMKLIVITYSNYCYECSLFFKKSFDTVLIINSSKISNERVTKIVCKLVALLSSITKNTIGKLETIRKWISDKTSNEIIDALTSHIRIIYYSIWITLYDIKHVSIQRNKEHLFSKYTKRGQARDVKLLKANLENFLTYNSKLKPSYFSPLQLFAFLIVIGGISAHAKWLNDSSALLNETITQFNNLTKNNDKLLSFTKFMVQMSTIK